MEKIRKPFQGIYNIIRFNWHFYVIAILLVIALSILARFLENPFQNIIYLFVILIVLSSAISLIVSFYVYDLSKLYQLNWIKFNNQNLKVANINAGFDETSILLKQKFDRVELSVFDFYDPKKHTEVSIKRARKAYPPYPNTKRIQTTHLQSQDNSFDKIFLILSAHEVRDNQEKDLFFKELKRVLKPNGEIYIVEHLRDFTNFMAYNIGFFHFYSKKTWLKTFQNSGFTLKKELKITPFISTFILSPNAHTN